ncbi:MAG TPA: RNA-binding protein [bacterium]|nr:RNA-binding protein [bacterium]
MAKKLFIGNIDWGTSEEDLKALFAQYGEVSEAVIIIDRRTGRSKGFGFVTFSNDEDGDKAIEELNGYEHNGRALVVNEARPRE